MSLAAQSGSEDFPPLRSGERLLYNLKWPSGLSVGEAVLRASRTGEELHMEVSVVADLPQHRVNYTFTAVAAVGDGGALCSREFRHRSREGRNAWEESLEFDQDRGMVRVTQGGRTTERAVPACARDPLTQLYHFRQQLAQGNVPLGTPQAAGEFSLGGDYRVRYESVVPEAAKPGQKPFEGERLLISFRNGGGESAFEVWIRSDAARTPAAARMSFPLAVFSAELQ